MTSYLCLGSCREYRSLVRAWFDHVFLAQVSWQYTDRGARVNYDIDALIPLVVEGPRVVWHGRTQQTYAFFGGSSTILGGIRG